MVGVDSDEDEISPEVYGLIFHPDLIYGTALGKKIGKYSFFSYEQNEALHLSDQEREIIMDCFHKIEVELEHPVDKHTRELLSVNIELLLDYCLRFYDRQFYTREKVNNDVLIRFEQLSATGNHKCGDYLPSGILPTKFFFLRVISATW